MKRMLKNNVLVRKLVGIETAGNINVLLTDKTKLIVDAPTKMPDRSLISKTFEPYVKISVYSPKEYIYTKDRIHGFVRACTEENFNKNYIFSTSE